MLNNSAVSKTVTGKYIKENDLLNGQFSVNNNMLFKALILRSNFCGYRDAYIAVEDEIDRLATEICSI